MRRAMTPLVDLLRHEALKVVIFDFDGTLVDIRPPLRRAVGEVFNKHSIYRGDELDQTLREISAILEAAQALPLTKIILNAHDIFKVVSGLEHLRVLRKLKIGTEIFAKYPTYARDAALFPGARALIRHLAEFAELFIVSHSRTDHIRDYLARHDLASVFTGIFGTDALPAMKPDPRALDPVLIAMDAVAPGEIVMVGDMPTDVDAAHGAGIHSIGVASGLSQPAVLRDAQPTLLVDSLLQLNQLLGVGDDEEFNTGAPTPGPAREESRLLA